MRYETHSSILVCNEQTVGEVVLIMLVDQSWFLTQFPPCMATTLNKPQCLQEFLRNTNEAFACPRSLEQRASSKQAKISHLQGRLSNYIVVLKWAVKPSHFVTAQNFRSVKSHIEWNQVSLLQRGQRITRILLKNNLRKRESASISLRSVPTKASIDVRV